MIHGLMKRTITRLINNETKSISAAALHLSLRDIGVTGQIDA